MSRLDHDTNEWQCKIVLFGAPTLAAVKLAARVVTTFPANEREVLWDNPPADDQTLVARYRPSASSLGELQPVYAIHTFRSAGSTATDRQHILHNTDGVILLIDNDDLEQSQFAERELERFLGMFGKTIESMPVVFLSTQPLDESQQAMFHVGNHSLFAGDTPANLQRAVTTLTSRLEEDSGLAGIGFDLDDFEEDSEEIDLDDVEFDDWHAYDDEEPTA